MTYFTNNTAQYRREKAIGMGRIIENEYRRRGLDVKFCPQCLEFKPTQEFVKITRVGTLCQDCSSKLPAQEGISVLRSRVLTAMRRVFNAYRGIEISNITAN